MSECFFGLQVVGFVLFLFFGLEVIGGVYVMLEWLDVVWYVDLFFVDNLGQDWLWDYMFYGLFVSLQEYCDWQVEMVMKVDLFFYVLCDMILGWVGGLVFYLWIDLLNGVIEIGYIQILFVMQCSLVVIEVILLMIWWVFEVGYCCVEWKCNVLNVFLMLVVRCYGFCYEGMFCQYMLVEGCNCDFVWFVILDDEWVWLGFVYVVWLDLVNFDGVGWQCQVLLQLMVQVMGWDQF